ncbi:ABC transporter permease [Sphingomonas sp. AOB5]|uniref:ABC transporter permease n=1 Tax=Sphingomonas sp. AOB5 TaxID=3034017 RepID=UPI0023F9C1F2|nr:ABC transporter permease [Sphingomonas sp. AOB5]MDF7777305.1 ABC transporter permease [Sphingomonas sp. AOB5]
MKLIRAELTKLTRQRGATFWGFLAIPLLLTMIACVLASIGAPPGSTAEVRAIRSLLRALSIAGNPIAQLFFAVGAAAIFAVEYRHSGWRHLVPRRSRSTLMLAKMAAFLIGAFVSLMLVAAGDILASMAVPLIRGAAPVAADWKAGASLAILLTVLVSLVELAILGASVALVAVVTRSGMAAILVPFLVALACAVAQTQFDGPVPLPAFAADTLRAMIAAPFESRAPDASVWTGLAVLLGWLAATIGLTLALFQRQDLTSE